MGNLKTDSPLSRRIVRSFLDFLNSVEPAPGVDFEGLEVARECLMEVFKLDSASINDVKSDSLVDIFSSLEASEDKKIESDLSHRGTSDSDPCSSSACDVRSANSVEAAKLGDNWTRETQSSGVSKDELFGQFFAALEKIHFFRPMTDGNGDPAQLDKATCLFEDALHTERRVCRLASNDSEEVTFCCAFIDTLILLHREMERSGCQAFDCRNLAETFKCQGVKCPNFITYNNFFIKRKLKANSTKEQWLGGPPIPGSAAWFGNRAMQSKLYSDAIELYSLAVSLCDDHAVYYCNRAAAYTQICKYNEAIKDCLKSIEIDHSYCKAYSRLGLAYYAQGNYADAIEKGFKKALRLDPNNQSVIENIRVAEQKLKDEPQRADWDRSASSSHNNQGSNNHSTGSRSHGASPPFSMPFDISALPTNIANMFINMAGSAYQGQPSQNRQGEDMNVNGSEEAGIRMGGGNINLNFGEQMNMPEELTGAFRSMMGMFSGTSSHGNNTRDTNGRSASN
ncbi:Small glutamine-rich tetratricopeptide repeat-containing beta [Gossypium arboreum]|uniref:Small glutamine-rich tetratricopeptide repeat-containing beta n=1 Tax=Gossypium arboreum TaxID=29729 RepID=A0A0B0N1L7_GOSAR|nr:Small glutamine-rich tetratricopeptide repeat-containing beta [Gossypium arboreum]